MAGAPSKLLFLTHRRPFSLLRSTRRHFLTTISTTTNHHLLCLTPIKLNQSFHSTPTTFSLPVNYHNPGPSHPWPEWFQLLESLSLAGYFNPNSNNTEDKYIADVNLPMKFLNSADSCLAFVRDSPDILRLLPRKDMEVVVNNGYPFLFKSGQEIERRMRSFLQNVVCLKCECRRPHKAHDRPGSYNSSTLETLNTYVRSRLIQNTKKEERTERWFTKVKELHGVTDQTSSTSNDDFPQIMPIRKEENHFVDNMNKDRLSSPYLGSRNEPMPEGNRILISGDINTNSSSNQLRKNEPTPEIGQQTTKSINPKSGWTGKSLEGSAVTEPDPLDMSEEAKTERWFRRVAQIKDISELSQIPDEDFPSIMPMRKGVNRFVVSKRKTPLERRLTSPHYRKNLRIMSSDSMKNEGNDDD